MAAQKAQKCRTEFEDVHYDEAILHLLKDSRQAMSLELISFITGIRKDRACKVLKNLRRWKLVVPATVQKVTFYKTSS